MQNIALLNLEKGHFLPVKACNKTPWDPDFLSLNIFKSVLSGI